MDKIINNHEKLDLMAAFMDTAAQTRGIETRVREIDNVYQAVRRSKFWLSFYVNRQEFCYAKGALLEYGKDRRGNLGLHLNEKAKLLAADKYASKQFLKEHGFSVPEGKLFRRNKLKLAFKAYNEFSGLICVKPRNGSLGKYVYTSIGNQEQFEYAIKRVAEKYPNILVEESVLGEHYRFFYVYPAVVGIRRGIPMNVVGDGSSSITELVTAKNAERRHRALPIHPAFEADDETLAFLATQNLNFDYIPSASERVFLSGCSNFTKGAETILYRLDQVHHSYLDIVVKACMAVPGLRFSGVDMIIKNVSQPAESNNYWFLELNISPALSGFYYPWQGTPVDVAGHLIDLLKTSYPF